MDDVGKTPPGLSQGYSKASEHLFLLVYEELRRLAAQRLENEASGQTLQPTALVHEAYLRLTGRDGVEQIWDGRGHFFAAAAEAMRRILVDNARRKQRVKRGGGQQRISLEAAESMVQAPSEDLVALDEALVRLTAHDPAKAEVVKLRFFAGLTMPEVALTLNISLATAERHWTYARTWLYVELSNVEPDNSREKNGPT
jgi:RNA polymerase sigma factor (TIGR02999 family)